MLVELGYMRSRFCFFVLEGLVFREGEVYLEINDFSVIRIFELS